jgi:hypothetical protein
LARESRHSDLVAAAVAVHSGAYLEECSKRPIMNGTTIATTFMLEHIKHQEDLLAIIVRNDFAGNGVHFFTPDEFSQQLAYMRHPQGKLIEPHMHNIVPRNITYTQEVLIIKRGRLRVDFYDRNRTYC